MFTQLVPVNKERHAKKKIKQIEGFQFASGFHIASVMAHEFVRAAAIYPIVFLEDKAQDQFRPVVLLGLNEGENLFVDDAGKWQASYLPAFLRRYPFVFAASDDGQNLTLCLDESYPGINDEGKGERLFDADGEQTTYLKGVLEFLQTYQAHHQLPAAFCAKLVELDLLEPMEASYSIKEKKSGRLTGFKAISREKLKALSDEQVSELFRADYLELIYRHLGSLANFTKTVETMGKQLEEAA